MPPKADARSVAKSDSGWVFSRSSIAAATDADDPEIWTPGDSAGWSAG